MNTTKTMKGTNNIMSVKKDLPEQVRIMLLQVGTLKSLYKQTKEKLKNTKLEDLTEEDIYILYLSQETDIEDLYKPEIQQLLIKHGFINSLLKQVDYICDKQVIKNLFKNKQFVNLDFIIRSVSITNIEIIELEDVLGWYYIIFHFIDKENQETYSIEPVIPLDLSTARKYKNEIMTNKDNMLVILDSMKTRPVTLVKQ